MITKDKEEEEKTHYVNPSVGKLLFVNFSFLMILTTSPQEEGPLEMSPLMDKKIIVVR